MKKAVISLSVLFTVFSGTAADAQLELAPGYEVCSIYWNQCAASREAEFSGKVSFALSPSREFAEALPLVFDTERKTARGSLLRLREDTAYRIRLEINDNGKKETVEREFRTKKAAVPIARTILLDGSTRLPLTVTDSGKPDGYIRYAAKPGTVLSAGERGDNAITVKGASYVIFDGLTVTGGRKNAFSLEQSTGIRIVNCDISGYGRSGVQQYDKGGGYRDARGSKINYDSGIRIFGCRDILIERNFIHSPRGTANPWFYDHPNGPNAVFIGDTVGATLRYNDFIGSDLHRWNDAVEGHNNNSETGGPRRDAEITGNYFAFGNDDAMELDGGQENTRFFFNRSEGTFCGISTTPCRIGPSWIYCNIFSGMDGDVFGFTNFALKNTHRNRGSGRVYYFNNTIVGNWGGMSGVDSNSVRKDTSCIVSRNNVFATGRTVFSMSLFRWKVDFDNDLFRKAGKFPADQERNGVEGSPKFAGPARNDFRLAAGSPGTGKACAIPGLVEAGADLGAYQPFLQGDLPYRPLPVRCSAERLAFAASPAGEWMEQKITLTASDPEFRGKFTVRSTSGAFFRVTPESGELTGKEPLELTVTIDREKITRARMNSGAFTVRFSDGLSRPVSVHADSTRTQSLLTNDRKDIVRGRVTPEKRGGYRLDFQLPKAGTYFLFVRSDAASPATFAVALDGKAVPYVWVPSLQKRAGGMRWMSPWLGFTERNANLPTELIAGAHTVEIKAREGQSADWKIEDCALAASPEALLLAPYMP